jgi:hypothetical protein
MAKILFGAGVGDARGSIGAMTFTKGRYGAVLRQKVSPVQPRSSLVLTIRSLFATLSRKWAYTLTDAQRAGWLALASITTYTNAFGNSNHPTGLQLYQSCNRNLQLLGAPLIADAPANLNVTSLLTISPTIAKTAQVFSVAYTATPVPATHDICIEAGPQNNPGRANGTNGLRFLNSFGPASASPADMAAKYIAKFGAIQAGQKITVRAFMVNETNGAASTPLVTTVTVAA